MDKNKLNRAWSWSEFIVFCIAFTVSDKVSLKFGFSNKLFTLDTLFRFIIFLITLVIVKILGSKIMDRWNKRKNLNS